MHLTQTEYRALLRQDLCAFIQRAFHALNPHTEFLPNWHIEVISAELEKCRTGETKRLIINVPPRSLKSHCASIAFPAFLLGQNPSAQIICTSYGQQLADKLAADCRSVMTSEWYKDLFKGTRLASGRQALNDFMTTRQGCRLSTSVGGILTGRGADYIIIDDPLKPDEALSETQRKAVNDWYDHTLVSRLNDKNRGCIIVIMQRLHEDDLVGHIQRNEDWRMLKFPAIAEQDEGYSIKTPYGPREFQRKAGEVLHAARERLAVLDQLRQTLGEYNFAGQYQQNPAPLGGGLVKAEWFRTYVIANAPTKFDLVFQSWDTANKPTELSDYSVCTTWGVKDKHLYLINVLRKRLGYAELKRAVREQAEAFQPQTVLIEDKASGTQLIQELVNEGIHEVKRYEQPAMDKIMRIHSVTSTMENGFVHLPDQAPWRDEYLHELTTFPNGKHDDQADSTSQALDWFKQDAARGVYGLLEYYKREAERIKKEESSPRPFRFTRGDALRQLDRWRFGFGE